MVDLTGRRAIVTGGGRGIGREIALRLAERGGDLLLVGRDATTLERTAREIEERGGTAGTLAVDLTEEGAPDRIVGVAHARGGFDTLVNNAGNVRAGRLETVPPADVVAMLNLNLTAAILMTQAALPTLTRGDRGLVVNLASGIALVPLPFYTVYAATKTGIAGFGHALRRELIGTAVHVATVYPGATDTDMMTSSAAGEDLGFGRRSVEDVVADMMAALERGEHEINTAKPSRRALQDLHREDPVAADDRIAPLLPGLEEATVAHRSI